VGGGRAGSRQLPSLSHDDMDNFRRTKHTETQEILEGKSSPRGKPGLQHSTFHIIALIRAQLCIQPQPTRSVRAILSRCFSFVRSVSSAFVKPPLPSPEPTLCSPRLPSPGTGGVHVAAEAAIAGDWHDEVDESPVEVAAHKASGATGWRVVSSGEEGVTADMLLLPDPVSNIVTGLELDGTRATAAA